MDKRHKIEESAQDIVELVERLGEAEAKLGLLMKQIPALVWTTDVDLQITSVSGSGLSRIDAGPEDLIGISFEEYQLGSEDDIGPAINAHREALNGERVSYEIELGASTFQAYVEPLHDAEGTIVGCQGMALDVTPRRTAENELRRTRGELESRVRDRTFDLSQALEELRVANEEIRQQNEELTASRQAVARERRRYRELFELAPDGYLLTDSDGLIREANDAAGQLLQVDPETLAGKPLVLFVADQDRGAFLAHLTRLRKEIADVWRVKRELRIQPRDGEAFDAALTTTRSHDAQGELVGFRWLLRDITKRKQNQREREQLLAQTERQRKRLEEAVLETQLANNLLHALINTMPVGVIVSDEKGSIVLSNPTARALGGNTLTGTVPDVPLRRADGSPLPPEELPFSRALETGEPVKNVELLLQSEEGDRYLLLSAAPVHDAAGTVTSAVLVAMEVTERRQALMELEAERSRLDTIVHSVPEGIVVTDAEARILFTNPTAERLYARPVPHGEGVESHKKLKLCHPDGRPYDPHDLPLTRSALYGEAYSNVEMLVVWPDGQRRDLLVNTVPIRDDQGEINGAVAAFQDITERKRIQEDLERYTNRLQALHDTDEAILAARSMEEIAQAALHHIPRLLECVHASVTVFEPDTDQMTMLAIYEEEGLVEENWRGPVDPVFTTQEFSQGKLREIEDLEALSEPSPLIETLRSKGVRSLINAPLAVQGEALGSLNLGLSSPGHLTSSANEIAHELADQLAIALHHAHLHERLRLHAEDLERLVARRTSKLRASERRLRSIFENAAIGIAVVDLDGRVLQSNLTLQEMVGYSAEELLGKPFVEITHPDDVEGNLELFEELKTGKRDQYTLEKRYLTKEGQTRWGSLTVSLIRRGDSEPLYAIGLVDDITEKKETQEALIRAEKLAIAGRLAASLAHEINNPLQSVIGCLGLAQETLNEGGDVSRYVDVAHEELKRAADIVARLRDLHRRSEPEDREPTDINTVLRKVLTLSRKECENQRVEVIWEKEDQASLVTADPDRLQQVFLNLVLNALDAMPEGGQLRIHTNCTEEPQGVNVVFKDGGKGIPAPILPHIFEPFYTTKVDGFGLGLFISHDIVERHGGHIEVESEPGQGSTFTVWLPA